MENKRKEPDLFLAFAKFVSYSGIVIIIVGFVAYWLYYLIN